MSLSLAIGGVSTRLEEEDAATDILLEDGSTWILLEGGDLTPSLLQGSVALKVNTIDFVLIDTPVPALGAAVTVTNPSWSGTVASATSADLTQLLDGHIACTVTGTNTTALPTDTAPFDLSDVPVPATFGDYLLEDGSGHYLLEDGTDWAPGAFLLEQPFSQAYQNLSVQKYTQTAGPNLVFGLVLVFAPGLRPGNLFNLTSSNQGYSATSFQITQITTTWPELAANPYFLVQFGNTPQTLAQWTQITAPAAAPVLTAPTPPAGPMIYGNATTGHTLFAAGGGIVTVATATFTVSAPIGHTLTVQVVGQIDCRAYGWNNYVATPRRAVRATLSGGIYTGAWQETPAGTATTAGARAIYDVSSGLGIALASGTYTVTLDIDTQSTNQMEVFSGWVQAAVTVV